MTNSARKLKTRTPDDKSTTQKGIEFHADDNHSQCTSDCEGEE
jgi:hypothetical protein